MYGLEGTEFEPSDEEIKEAARLANASDFIVVRLDFCPPSSRLYFPLTCNRDNIFRNYLLDTTLKLGKGVFNLAVARNSE